jgi:HEPN domain-containing protein
VSDSDPAEWLRLAERDWRRVGLLLDVKDAAAAGFFLQQSLEKYLKGWLIGRGWHLRRTHELDRLLDAAGEYEASLHSHRALCERVSGYYIVERYPGDFVEGPDVDQLRRDMVEARVLLAVLFPGVSLWG